MISICTSQASSGRVLWDTAKQENALDVDYLDEQEKNDLGFNDRITRQATYKQLRQALSSRSVFCLYACHAALGRELCSGIAKYFRVNVRAFSDEVRYHPNLLKNGALEVKYSIGDNPLVTNFHDLDKHFAAPFTPSR
jgi:hypothetical protein